MSSLVLKLIDSAEGFSVRGVVTPEGFQFFSVFDFMTTACGYKDTGASARKEYIRLTSDGSEYKDEVVASCRYLKFPGRGQRETPCMTIRGLQRLLMILGGKVAAEFREIIEGTFTRVMAGDQSLIEVINANAASQGPVQQAYRAGLAQEPVAPDLDAFCLGWKRNREDRLFDMEMQERQQRLAESRLQQAQKSASFLQSLKGMAGVDERTKIQLEDFTKNTLFNSMAVTITGGAASVPPAEAPSAAINVSIVAKEMGYKLTDAQLQCVGREMAKRYRETYQCEPPKHKQYVAGNFIPVNSYMERDRSLMEQVIRSVVT
jgi:hypothetical protein